jgi:fructose-1,6-bisphosphatase I
LPERQIAHGQPFDFFECLSNLIRFSFSFKHPNVPDNKQTNTWGDAMSEASAIGAQLDHFLDGHAQPEIAVILGAMARAAVGVAALIRRGPLAGADLAATTGGANNDGDVQKLLDVTADKAFLDGLRGSGVRALISEEADEPAALDVDGRFLVAIDPLDGSSNIDTNISIGTIFSVLESRARGPVAAAEFLQPGRAQRAAGFIMYGPQTTFVFSVGAGTHAALYDPERDDWFVTRLNMTIPAGSAEYAINASNYRHWSNPVKAYIEECLAGAEGPRGKNFNMRWVAAVVCDAYRILVRGGVFLYPADDRRGYEKGRLRHCYEASPLAFVIEQAGGGATNGLDDILDLTPRGIHDRVPLIFGAREKVEGVRSHFRRGDYPADRSPLFSNRGLLRS